MRFSGVWPTTVISGFLGLLKLVRDSDHEITSLWSLSRHTASSISWRCQK
jgi:hypothetical protein